MACQSQSARTSALVSWMLWVRRGVVFMGNLVKESVDGGALPEYTNEIPWLPL